MFLALRLVSCKDLKRQIESHIDSIGVKDYLLAEKTNELPTFFCCPLGKGFGSFGRGDNHLADLADHLRRRGRSSETRTPAYIIVSIVRPSTSNMLTDCFCAAPS